MLLRRVVLSFVIAFGLGAPMTVAPAFGTLLIFNSEPSFLAFAPIVSTEKFDEFPSRTILGTGTVVIDGVTYTAGAGGIWEAGDIVFPLSGANVLSSHLIETNTLAFGNGAATSAIGFFVRYPGTQNPPATSLITVTTVTGQQTTETFVFPFQSEPLIYRGYFAVEGIASVLVSNTPDSRQGFNWGFDNVSRAAIVQALVPEASCFLLMFTAMLVLFIVGSWRRRLAPLHRGAMKL